MGGARSSNLNVRGAPEREGAGGAVGPYFWPEFYCLNPNCIVLA